MPHYEFHCERCKKEVTLTLSIGERERGDYKCPGCGGTKLTVDGHVLFQDVQKSLRRRA